MKYTELERRIIDLPFDTPTEIYNNGKQILYVLRPSTLSKGFSTYNVNKNVQIWLKNKETGKEFKPNHFRLLLDVYNRVHEFPEAKDELLKVFDDIFYGEDPLIAMIPLEKYDFKLAINPLDISVCLAQLFIAEQAIGFGGISKYNPPSLYIQGWIREFINENFEIDQVVWGITHRRPPHVRYTKLDNKNHREYNPDAQSLWYK